MALSNVLQQKNLLYVYNVYVFSNVLSEVVSTCNSQRLCIFSRVSTNRETLEVMENQGIECQGKIIEFDFRSGKILDT